MAGGTWRLFLSLPPISTYPLLSIVIISMKASLVPPKNILPAQGTPALLGLSVPHLGSPKLITLTIRLVSLAFICHPQSAVARITGSWSWQHPMNSSPHWLRGYFFSCVSPPHPSACASFSPWPRFLQSSDLDGPCPPEV